MINLEIVAIVVLLAVVVYLLVKKSKPCKVTCVINGEDLLISRKPPKDTPPPLGDDPIKP